MNSLFYIKILNTFGRYFKINCPKEQYLKDISKGILSLSTIDDSVPCYSQIYSNNEYIVDLNSPNFSCNLPFNARSYYTYRTLKIRTSGPTDIRIYKRHDTVNGDDINIFLNESNGDLPGDNMYSTIISKYNSYTGYIVGSVPLAGTYYITIRQRFTYSQFTTNIMRFVFDDADTPPPVEGIEKYLDIFTSNKKYQIIYNNEQFDLDYKIEYDEIYDGQSEINSLIFKIPDNVPISNHVLYPIIYDENNTNNEFVIDENDVDNTATIGLFKENDIIQLNDFNFSLELKNKHTTWNYKVLKDLLFSVSDTMSNLECNIYYDSTTLFKNIIIGDMNQFNLNLYIMASYDVSKIYYEIYYINKNAKLNEITEIKYFNSDTYIPLINAKIAEILQDTDDQNCIIFDKSLDKNNDNFNILNIKQTFKKYLDLLDHNNLFKNKLVSTEKNIDYQSIGYTDNLVYDHILSEHGYINKINDNLYSLVQFTNPDATNLINNKTLFIELHCIDGTNYSVENEINIPIDIIDSTINDAIYYGNKVQYIELLKNDIISTIFIDMINNDIYYQSNLDHVNNLDGLKYYPIKSTKDNVIYLTRTSIDEIGNDIYKIIYNYKIMVDLFNSEYNENLIEDVQCPYIDIYLSDDRSYLFIELNKDSYLYNKNNKTMINLSDDNYYLNYNNSLNYSSGIGEIIKIDDKFITLTSIDSDNIIVENNQKLDNTNYIPIISYDFIDINQFNSIKILELNIPIEKDVIVIMTQKDNYLTNYPKNIIIYKKNNTNMFILPTNILNFNIDMIDNYYKIKRFIMKNSETELNYIHNLNS